MKNPTSKLRARMITLLQEHDLLDGAPILIERVPGLRLFPLDTLAERGVLARRWSPKLGDHYVAINKELALKMLLEVEQ